MDLCLGEVTLYGERDLEAWFVGAVLCNEGEVVLEECAEVIHGEGVDEEMCWWSPAETPWGGQT